LSITSSVFSRATLPSSVTVTDERAATSEKRAEPVDGQLYGPVEVGALLGVKPQVVVNWIRDDRIRPSAVDEMGRNRFTAQDVRAIRASLGHHRPGDEPVQGDA
jgi:hypothetical protein